MLIRCDYLALILICTVAEIYGWTVNAELYYDCSKDTTLIY